MFLWVLIDTFRAFSITSLCNCAYIMSVISFQFGDSQKLRLVRILRSTVMVRVGGGWMALDEFLVKNDPCRGAFVTFINCNVEIFSNIY